MKKFSFIALMIILAFITSCGTHDASFTEKDNRYPTDKNQQANNSDYAAESKISGSKSNDPDQVYTTYTPGVYSNTVTLDIAQTMINTYANYTGTFTPTPGPGISASSFSISANELLQYINNTSGNGNDISRIHLILGLNTATPPVLNLFIVGVNPKDGSHYYISNNPTPGTASTYSVLQCTLAPTDITTLLNPITLIATSRNGTLDTFKECLFLDDGQPNTPTAKNMIMKYNTDAAMVPQPRLNNVPAFSINSLILANYIRYVLKASGDPNSNIVFLLAEEYNRLTMVMAGVKSDNKTFVFLKSPTRTGIGSLYLLEHVMPCPECIDINNFGLSLETPIASSGQTSTASVPSNSIGKAK